MKKKLSIIIPTLNEARTLGRTLEDIQALPAEIIVSDGGSRDGTVALARQYTSHVLHTTASRGLQMDVGARYATGDVLLFLHADTLLPPNAYEMIDAVFQDRRVVFGAFHLAISSHGCFLAVIAFGANLRSKFFRLPFGDQALFVRKPVYSQIGGFRHWPVMEDVDLVRRLNRAGLFRLVPSSVQTSARRWEQEKPLFTTVRNLSLLLRYFLGVSPHALARFYGQKR